MSNSAEADVIFRDVQVFDGHGAEPWKADLAVAGDRIAAIGDLGDCRAEIDISAKGLAISPGFIDVHTHDDRFLLTHREMTPKVSQGVTTVVTGNCGLSLVPWPAGDVNKDQFPFNLWLDKPEYLFTDVGAYFEQLEKTPPATNVAVLVGHSTLRYGAMAALDRPATAAEIDSMREALAAAMAAGAIGMSSGLYYPPAQAATRAEVTEVAAAMAPFDGIYTAHMRNEGDNVIEAIHETAGIARDAGVQLCISHHKASGPANFGKTRQTLPLIEKLSQEQRLTLDVYPYDASSTMLAPEWLETDRRVIVTWSHARPEVSGRDLDDIAAEMGLSREETARQLQPAGAVYFHLDEADVQRVLKFPRAMIGSDGIPDDEHPHPRLWGTFARVLGHYARDLGLLSMAEAVHRMTALPARQFGFRDRGVLRPGAYADLVLFDPLSIKDSASFSNPRQAAIGIHSVWVNGRAVWREGKNTKQYPGRPLRLQDTDRQHGG